MQSDITILDGGWGTLLRERGMPASACPETWALAHPELLTEIAISYVHAGAQQVLAPTIGAGPVRLRAQGLEGEFERINRDLVAIVREAVPKVVLVGGSMGPSGLRLSPHSAMLFEDAVTNYASQAQALCEGGVDFFQVETMTDLNEARAALIGIRQVSNLPVYVTMYFTNGETPAGDLPACCTIVLEGLGAEGVGGNCTATCAELRQPVEEMARYARKPVIAKPSAGLPGQLVPPEEFAQEALQLGAAGARMLGACCGSNPEYIHALQMRTRGLRFLPQGECQDWMLSSRRRFLPFANALIIGNLRVSSSARFLARIRMGDYSAIHREIDIMGDAQMLCIHAVAEDLDEVSALAGLAQAAWEHSDLPLAFRPQRPAALEAALRGYPGRALVIMDCVAEGDQKKIQQVAKHYGALCMM